jgi:hypothetical protein
LPKRLAEAAVLVQAEVMRILPGAVFAVIFATLSQLFFRGSVVAALAGAGFGLVMGEMVFEPDE